MRLVCLAALSLLVPRPAGAEAPPTQRFRCPRAIVVSPLWIAPGPRLRVHVAVVHECRDGKLCHDGRTYRLDDGLAEALHEDFGPFAPLALRRIEQRVMELGGPHPPGLERVRLAAVAHIHRQLPYRVLPHIFMLQNTELWVHRLALALLRRTGHVLTITSGTRRAEKQAAAMYGKLERRARYRGLYKKRELAEEIRQAYRAARRRGKRRGEVIAAMQAVIEDQVRRGLYVSAHLKQVAVDVRSHDMRRKVKRVFRRIAESMEGMGLIPEEKRPPHFHLEVPAVPAVPGCPHLEVVVPTSQPASMPASAPTAASAGP